MVLELDGDDFEESTLLLSSEDRRHIPEGSSKSDAGKIATRCSRSYVTQMWGFCRLARKYMGY